MNQSFSKETSFLFPFFYNKPPLYFSFSSLPYTLRMSSSNEDSPKESTPKRRKIIKWHNDVGGKDNLTSDARIASFFKAESKGENTDLIVAPSKRYHNSLRNTARRCQAYFEKQGIRYREAEDIRARMKILEKYRLKAEIERRHLPVHIAPKLNHPNQTKQRLVKFKNSKLSIN